MEIFLSYGFIFLLGSAVGSFLNVIICRLETKEGIVGGRSHCPQCGQTLRWFDLIPLLSFVWLRGRCRYCRGKISWQYPLVELATGLLFIVIYRFGNFGFESWDFFRISDFGFRIFELVYLLYVTCSLFIVFVYDLRHYIIPDKVLFPAVAITFFWQIFSSLKIGHWSLIENWSLVIGHFYPYLLSAFGAAAFFALLILITRGRGMGLGDAKLAFLMGLTLGWPGVFVALMAAFFTGSLVGLALIAAGRKKFDSQIPFGPFLAGATILTLFYGQWLVDNWWLNCWPVL